MPKCFHLALRDEVLDGPSDVLDRDVRIDPVLVEEIDGFDAKSLERSLDGLPDTIGPAVDASIFSGLEINVEAELGGDDHLVADRAQSFADDVFVGEGAIDLGRVEKGHAAVHRSADQGHALVLGEFRGVAETDPHAAETNGRHF
jgi:hypothetical protein